MGGLPAASSPPRAALPAVSNLASLLYLRKGQEEFQGFFFSKINRTLDLFHQAKKKEQALFLVGTGLEPGRGCCAEGKGAQEEPALLTKEFLPPKSSEGHQRNRKPRGGFPRAAWQ